MKDIKKEILPCCKNNSCNEKELEGLKDFLRVISDKNRLRIICTLRCEKRCVCEVYEHLNLSQNLTSHHLRLLEKAELVSWEKIGVKVFYKLNTKNFKDNMRLLNKFLKV